MRLTRMLLPVFPALALGASPVPVPSPQYPAPPPPAPGGFATPADDAPPAPSVPPATPTNAGTGRVRETREVEGAAVVITANSGTVILNSPSANGPAPAPAPAAPAYPHPATGLAPVVGVALVPSTPRKDTLALAAAKRVGGALSHLVVGHCAASKPPAVTTATAGGFVATPAAGYVQLAAVPVAAAAPAPAPATTVLLMQAPAADPQPAQAVLATPQQAPRRGLLHWAR